MKSIKYDDDEMKLCIPAISPPSLTGAWGNLVSSVYCPYSLFHAPSSLAETPECWNTLVML